MIIMIETTLAIIRASKSCDSCIFMVMILKVFFFFIVGKTIMLMFKILGSIYTHIHKTAEMWDTSAISWLDHVNHLVIGC